MIGGAAVVVVVEVAGQRPSDTIITSKTKTNFNNGPTGRDVSQFKYMKDKSTAWTYLYRMFLHRVNN